MLEAASLFSATSIHLDQVMSALNCLTPFGQREDVQITIDKEGLSFVRENHHAIKIQLFLSKELFQYYNYRADPEDPNSYLRLSMKINHIFESVNMVNRAADDPMECTLSYNGNGSPFVLILEDSFITEKVEYSTYVINDMDSTGLELDRSRLEFECIIKGDILYSALKDLKEIGCRDCYIYAMTSSRSRPVFALLSKSQLGFSKITLPSERSILEKLEVYNNDSKTLVHESPVLGMFDFNSLDKIRLSTKIASKVLLRKDIHGLLAINILSQTKDLLLSDRKSSRVSSNSLPMDYPGIVVEVSLLEKASADEVDVKEIHTLMTGASNSQPLQAAGPAVTANAEKGDEESNLLGIHAPKVFPADEKPDDSYHPAASIPLFF